MKLSSFHSIFYLLLATCSSVVHSASFSCPASAGSSDFTAIGSTTLFVPASKGLCTLVQVSPDGESFKPVGRTYAGNAWEAYSGQFASLSWSCSGSTCVVNLPALDAGAKYQLTTFATPTSSAVRKNDIARFLEQATFGPTRADINKLNAISNLPQAYAAWIKDQQDTVPLTSHRAAFRERMNAKMETATRIGAVTHPCQKGSRFRRYAFSSKDYGKYMEIKTVGTKRIIKIDGFVRTVVQGPVYQYGTRPLCGPMEGTFSITSQQKSSLLCTPIFATHPNVSHSYQISNAAGTDIIGGNVYMYLPSAGGNTDASFNGNYGNPTIQFDSSIGANPNVVITLSTSVAAAIDNKYFTTEA
ncbi:Protein of unknown function (DUF1501) [Fragilaria crotonensis]|nr:Protein of unknown function (DUF1501) [Fragilaria crotonensis]